MKRKVFYIVFGFILIAAATIIIACAINNDQTANDEGASAPDNSQIMDWIYKPLIYLYPEAETHISIRLGCPDLLTTTYPKYDDIWNVVAQPNGDLTDASGRTYYGLYWEGVSNLSDNFPNGFVVAREDTITFLEEKLAHLGLTEREANEFIIYWLPKLEESPYNLIRFAEPADIDAQMPLIITPTPDTIIRVRMVYQPLMNSVDITPQTITAAPNRSGFTVVEWGGTPVK